MFILHADKHKRTTLNAKLQTSTPKDDFTRENKNKKSALKCKANNKSMSQSVQLNSKRRVKVQNCNEKDDLKRKFKCKMTN